MDGALHAHFALEVLHDVEKVVVHVWLVLELDLDRVEVGERVGDIERATWVVWRARGHRGRRRGACELATWFSQQVSRLVSLLLDHKKCIPEEAKDSTSPPSSPTTFSSSPPSSPSYVSNLFLPQRPLTPSQ